MKLLDPGAFLALSLVASAQTTIVPNTFADGEDPNPSDLVCDVDLAAPGNQCTLRAALQTANALGGAVVIQLGAGTYALSTSGTDDCARWGDLDVCGTLLTTLTIQGGGPSTTIDAGPLAALGFPDRVVHVASSVTPGLRVELRDLALRGGRAGGGAGGGIRQDAGELVLTGVDVLDCQGNDGGGIRANGKLTMNGGSIRACASPGIGNGGGAYVATPGASTVTFDGVAFDFNSAGQRGGALRTTSGTFVQVRNCAFSGCTASIGGAMSWRGSGLVELSLVESNSAATGGGIAIDLGGTMTLARSTLRTNSADQGGAMNVAGATSVTLLEVAIEANTAQVNGGGIANLGTLVIGRSTISGNTSSGAGGGIHSLGRLVLELSTISANRAPNGSGGGLYFLGSQSNEISASTIAFNTAGIDGAGIHNDAVFGAPLVGIKSTLLDENRLVVSGLPDTFGGAPFPTSHGFNLDADGTCAMNLATDQHGSVATPLHAQLAPLANNGGATATHAIGTCSSAIDRGSATTISGLVLPFDQRTFPHVGQPDVGAFEHQAPFAGAITAFCFGTASACPCGIGGSGLCGCPNSVDANGACLTSTGVPSLVAPTLVLHGAGMPNSSALYFQGTSQAGGGAGLPFGDGLRCAGGSVVRLGVAINSGGASSFPSAGQPSIPAQGMVFVPGTMRTYQVWYRNADPAYCTPATFNLGNGLQVLWC